LIDHVVHVTGLSSSTVGNVCTTLHDYILCDSCVNDLIWYTGWYKDIHISLFLVSKYISIYLCSRNYFSECCWIRYGLEWKGFWSDIWE